MENLKHQQKVLYSGQTFYRFLKVFFKLRKKSLFSERFFGELQKVICSTANINFNSKNIVKHST